MMAIKTRAQASPTADEPADHGQQGDKKEIFEHARELLMKEGVPTGRSTLRS